MDWFPFELLLKNRTMRMKRKFNDKTSYGVTEFDQRSFCLLKYKVQF